MNEDKKPIATRWGNKAKQQPRRALDEDTAKRAGYSGSLRESEGWYRGARVTKRG